MLFLSFEGFTAVLCVLFFAQNSRSYQSKLMRVTEDIETPVPVGQYQHGSSRWMEEQEKDRVFSHCIISPSQPVVRKLLDSGYDGLDFLIGKGSEDVGRGGMLEDSKVPETADPIENEAAEEETERREDERETGEKEGFESVEYEFDGKAAGERKESAETGEPEAERRGEEISGSQPVHGNEQPATDRFKLLEEGGVAIGMHRCGNREKIHYIADDTHTLTIGATRSGKTRTLVLQSICLMALAAESLVISDPKAELYQYTAWFLEKVGYGVICLDFKNPEKSSRYNLL